MKPASGGTGAACPEPVEWVVSQTGSARLWRGRQRGTLHLWTTHSRPDCGRGIVIEQLIKLIPRLHFLQPIALTPVRFQVAQKFGRRFHGNAKRALRKDDDPITQLT